MPPVLPHALANGQVVDLDKVYADLQAIVVYLNGNALGADFLAASIPNSRLANKYFWTSVAQKILQTGGTWAVVGVGSYYQDYRRMLTTYRAPCSMSIKEVWHTVQSDMCAGKVKMLKGHVGGPYLEIDDTEMTLTNGVPSALAGSLITGLDISVAEGDVIGWATDAVTGFDGFPIDVGFNAKSELKA